MGTIDMGAPDVLTSGIKASTIIGVLDTLVKEHESDILFSL